MGIGIAVAVVVKGYMGIVPRLGATVDDAQCDDIVCGHMNYALVIAGLFPKAAMEFNCCAAVIDGRVKVFHPAFETLAVAEILCADIIGGCFCGLVLLVVWRNWCRNGYS